MCSSDLLAHQVVVGDLETFVLGQVVQPPVEFGTFLALKLSGCNTRQLLTFGLTDIEDTYGLERNAFEDFFGPGSLIFDDPFERLRSQDVDALRAFDNLAFQALPGPVPGHAGRVRKLQQDEDLVVQAVGVEAARNLEPAFEVVAALDTRDALLQLLHQSGDAVLAFLLPVLGLVLLAAFATTAAAAKLAIGLVLI